MLYVNIDLIFELLNADILDTNSENKLKDYDLVCESSLEEDIKLTSKEKAIIEIFNDERNAEINFIEKEKLLFTKLFVGNYLLRNGFVKHLEDAKIYKKLELFSSFASAELKNDKSFAKTILQLDGTYIKYMGDKIRNNRAMMTIAIENDTTNDVESFTLVDSNLKADPEMTLGYFKRMKLNQKESYSVDRIYEDIFIKENDQFTTKIFSNNEQANWLSNPYFLKELVKIDSNFIDYVIDGKISKLDSDNSYCKIKKYFICVKKR